VLLTTHDMTEVDRLSERVVLINHGRLVFDGPLERLRGQFGGDWQVRVTIADDDITDQRLDGVSVLRRDGRRVVFGPAPGSVLTPYEALRRIVRRWSVTDVSVEEEDLEAVMRAVYRQQRDDDRVGEPGKIAHRA
jgi:ABC-2 type transport system ATP-binding protein